MREILDLHQHSRVHVVGVGGPGMSAIATCLVQMGHEVSGSDIKNSDVINRLSGLGIQINIGHDQSVIHGCDAVTASSAIPQSNIELVAAEQSGVQVLTRAAMLASICAMRPSIAVAGTHGKTTTTSLLVRIFTEAGLDPNFVVGGDVLDEGVGARWTGSAWTIVEADESDGTHLELPLTASILTNVDSDHLDQYGDLQGVAAGFQQYLSGIQGPVVVCIDDPLIAGMQTPIQTVTYGFSSDANFRCHSIEATNGETTFSITSKDPATHSADLKVRMSLRGRHNVLNVTGAIAMAINLGVDPQVAIAAVAKFGGVGRRFEIIGNVDGITFVDDYAHLPREISAVISAAKTSDDRWGRLVAVFQPNRYHRMAIMSDEYADAFVDADVVVITDIYASGTKKIEGVTGHLVVDAVARAHPTSQILWHADRESLAEFVNRVLRAGDVCISMGCGDVEFLPREIIHLRSGGKNS
jgi:UDP-N-acetylmuramate--alanine ligase